MSVCQECSDHLIKSGLAILDYYYFGFKSNGEVIPIKVTNREEYLNFLSDFDKLGYYHTDCPKDWDLIDFYDNIDEFFDAIIKDSDCRMAHFSIITKELLNELIDYHQGKINLYKSFIN